MHTKDSVKLIVLLTLFAISFTAVDSFLHTGFLLGKATSIEQLGSCEVTIDDFTLNLGSSTKVMPYISEKACENSANQNRLSAMKSICVNTDSEGLVSVKWNGKELNSFALNCLDVAYDSDDKCTVSGELLLEVAEHFESGQINHTYQIKQNKKVVEVQLQQEGSYDVFHANVNANGILRGKKFIVASEQELISNSGQFNEECTLGVETETIDSDTSQTVAAELSTSPIPIYHSNPGSNYVIYLDFDGHITSGTSWNYRTDGADIITPAFDTDGNPSSFSNSELSLIQAIWERVAEDYSPFDVDVTTEEPVIDDLRKVGTSDSKWGIRVAIGGDSAWYGSQIGGVAYYNVFAADSDIPVFVFENNLGNGNQKYTAEAISHEVGHTVSLPHQGSSTNYYSSTAYCRGRNGWAPIMGASYFEAQTTWHNGDGREECSSSTVEIDRILSFIPFKADDHGDTNAQATDLIPSGSTIKAQGVIDYMDDIDTFSFESGEGQITIDVVGKSNQPNLDSEIRLFDSSGVLLATGDQTSLNSQASVYVLGGLYFIQVSSDADYGDIGQYSLTGTINADVACTPQTPTITIDPSSQVAFAGEVKSYTVTVENTDWGNCDSSTFTVDVTSDVSATLSASSFTLSPSQSQPITVSVSSDVTETVGDKSFTVTVNAGVERTASATGLYSVVSCEHAQPTMVVSPSSTNSVAGSSQDYTVSITSNDGTYCGQEQYSLQTTSPVGVTSSLSSTSVSLYPGETKDATLTVSSSTQTVAGDYSVLVSSTTNNHQASTQITHSVAETDSEPPTTPTNVVMSVKGKNVKLNWDPSTDNIGVVGYDIYRNAIKIVTTSETSYTEKASSSDSYYVVAFDEQGNPSAPSDTVSGDTVDTGGNDEPTNTGAQCSDGKDNDRDLTCDYNGCKVRGKIVSADPDCTGPDDNTE